MASTHLSRTPASSGNRRTFTTSVWVKRANLTRGFLFFAWDGSSYTDSSMLNFSFNTDDTLQVETGSTNLRTTTQVFRDTSAWYHIVFSCDTTQATASNRLKLYVNGSEITSFSSNSNVTQNTDMGWNHTFLARLGSSVSANYFDGCMAHYYNIDGQALTPSSFGETDATTGIWKPKSYSGSYGTNGFFLKFENSGSLGTDSSGNGNNFTVNGTPTQTVDTPSNVFCTLNPLIPISSAPTFSLGNLRVESSTANWRQSGSTLGVSTGKWYWEGKGVSGAGWLALHGIKKTEIASQSENYNFPLGYNDGAYSYYSGGTKYVNGTNSAYGNSWTVTDIISVALDCDNNYLYFAKNGTWQNSGVPTSGATGTGGISITSGQTWLPFVTTHDGGLDMNFGNGRFGTTAISSPFSDGAGLGKFQYTVPTGYYALCTKNINVYG